MMWLAMLQAAGSIFNAMPSAAPAPVVPPPTVAAPVPPPKAEFAVIDGWRILRTETSCTASSDATPLVLTRVKGGRNLIALRGATPSSRVEIKGVGGATLVNASLAGQPDGTAVSAETMASLSEASFLSGEELPAMTPMTGILARCIREVGAADHGSGKPAASKPALAAGFSISSDDYPSQALRAEMAGRTEVSFTVSAKGRISECRIAKSSGYWLLDETTCSLFSRRARFAPALDADGEATEATYAQGITWTVPQ